MIDLLRNVASWGEQHGSNVLRFANGLDELGVVGAYPDLKGSPYDPVICMSTITRELRFLGHTGSKWRTKHEDAFRDFLKRLSGENGRVQFLLSEDLTMVDVQTLKKQVEEYRALSVRIYSERPIFRLVIVDSLKCGLQYYPVESQFGDLRVGAREDYPVLEVHHFARIDRPSALYNAFDRLFDEEWRRARDI